MKRRILSNTSNSDIHPAFEELANGAKHLGYDLSVSADDSGTYNMTISISDKSEANKMPTIEVNTESYNGATIFQPKLKFPELSSYDEPYYDSIEYWLDRWAEVGKFITKLCAFEFDPSKYED